VLLSVDQRQLPHRLYRKSVTVSTLITLGFRMTKLPILAGFYQMVLAAEWTAAMLAFRDW
jgi:hypothetical protein